MRNAIAPVDCYGNRKRVVHKRTAYSSQTGAHNRPKPSKCRNANAFGPRALKCSSKEDDSGATARSMEEVLFRLLWLGTVDACAPGPRSGRGCKKLTSTKTAHIATVRIERGLAPASLSRPVWGGKRGSIGKADGEVGNLT